MIHSLDVGSDWMKLVVNRHGPVVLFHHNFIGEGMEARVYRKGEDAYKVYRLFSEVSRLSLADTFYLKNLETKRILLPQDALYTIFGRFRGYVTPYIEDLGLDSFVSLQKEELSSEFSLLQEDCQLLGEHHIRIHDLMTRRPSIQNGIFHRGLYVVDPGRFCFDFSLTPDEVTKKNCEEIDYFLFHRIARQYCIQNMGCTTAFYDEFDDVICQKDISLMAYILNDMKEITFRDYLERKNKNIKIKRK